MSKELVMDSKVEKIGNSKVKLTISASAEEFERYIDFAFKKLSANVEVPGFRPGKAPRKIIEEKIGSEKIIAEAVERAIPEFYFEAVKKNGLETLGRPEIQVTKLAEGNPFEFTAVVAVVPEVKLGDYKKLKVKRRKVVVSPAEVNEVLLALQKRSAKTTVVDRPARLGDRVEVDIEGEIDGVKAEKLTSKNHPLILGDKVMLPPFEDELVGLKKGDSKSFPLIFPKDYRDPGLAGKTAKMFVKVNEVCEVTLPELGEEFAKTWGAKNMDQLKQRIGEDLLKEAKRREEHEYRVAVVEALAKQSEVQVPDFLIEEELSAMIEEVKRGVERHGLPFAKYLEHLKKTEDDLRKEWREQARERVKISLIIRAVRKKENITVTAKEIDEEIELLSSQPDSIMQDSRQQDEIKKELTKPEGREYVASIVANKKTVDRLVAYASE